MQLGMQEGPGPRHIMLDGDPATLPQRRTAPQFWPISVVAKWLHGSRCHYCVEVGLSPVNFVLDRNPTPLPKKGVERWNPPPKFSTHVHCGQMAGWIKMPLGMNVGLSPGDFMLDGDPAPLPKKGAHPPSQIFDSCLL